MTPQLRPVVTFLIATALAGPLLTSIAAEVEEAPLRLVGISAGTAPTVSPCSSKPPSLPRTQRTSRIR